METDTFSYNNVPTAIFSKTLEGFSSTEWHKWYSAQKCSQLLKPGIH
jgi:hypothetical protein